MEAVACFCTGKVTMKIDVYLEFATEALLVGHYAVVSIEDRVVQANDIKSFHGCLCGFREADLRKRS